MGQRCPLTDYSLCFNCASHLTCTFTDHAVSYTLSTECDSTYRKVPVVGRLDFELKGCKVKIFQKYGSKVNFEISHILESSMLTLYVA